MPDLKLGYLIASALLFSASTGTSPVATFIAGHPWLAILEFAFILSSLAALLFPSSKKALGLMCVTFLAWIVAVMPLVPNHRIVLGLMMLLCLTLLSRRNASIQEVFIAAKPTLAWLAIIVYLFAAFAKLNTTFLDSSYSCAVRFYKNILAIFPFMPTDGFFIDKLPIIVVISEFILAVLLLFTATRKATVVFGILFHLALSLDMVKHFLDFSAVMTILLLCHLNIAKHKTLPKSLYTATFGCFVLIHVMRAGSLIVPSLAFNNALFQQLLFFAWVGFVLSIVFDRETVGAKLQWPGTIGAVILLLAFINGASIYLGFKSRTAFTMYSNLRVEADDSNHLIVSKSLGLIDKDKLKESNLLVKKLAIFQPAGATAEHQCIW